jgi:hypothetical protein
MSTVSALAAAIDALVAVEVDELDDESLHELTVGTQRLRDRLEVAAGRLLARWDARQVWRNDQSLSPAARLGRELNASPRTARAMQRVPAAATAVGSGRLSADHVELLAGAAGRAPDRYAADEAMLVAHCTTLRFADAERVIRYWVHHVDPDGNGQDAAETAGASVSETIDGTVSSTPPSPVSTSECSSTSCAASPTRSATPMPREVSFAPLGNVAPPH